MTIKARSRIKSLGCAIAGIIHVAQHEPNMRIHLGCGAIAVSAGMWLRIDAESWRWVALSLALVTSAECLNTAVERVCDVADPQFNPLIKQAKDAAAGAVLLTAAFAMWIGIALVFEYF